MVLDAALRDFNGDNVTGLSLAGLQHKVGGSDDNGGELAEIEREQDGLVEEGSSLRINIMTMADKLMKATAVRDNVARDLGDKQDRFVDGLLSLQNNTTELAEEPARIASERDNLTGGLVGARVTLADMATLTGVKGDRIIKEGSVWQNAEELADELARVASERDRERDNMGTGPDNAGLPLLQLHSTVNLNTAHTVCLHKSHAGTGSCGSSTAPHKDEARRTTREGDYYDETRPHGSAGDFLLSRSINGTEAVDEAAGMGPDNAGLPILQLRSNIKLNTAHTVRLHKSDPGTGSCEDTSTLSPTGTTGSGESTTTPRQRITRSMTVARQKENPPRGNNNADGPPRESNVTPTLTDRTDEASDDEVQWDHPEERADDEVVRNDAANVNKDRRGCPVDEITDWTDDTDNGLSWDYSEERDDDKDDDDLSNNNRATPPANAVAPHRKALLPPHQLVISNFATQNTHGLRRRPCNIDGKSMIYKPHDYTHYEHLITSMKTKSLDVYFVQGTWLEGDMFDEIINGYHVF